MAKDEDVCLHCGLCAERCPTGAWDMQKFLLDMTHAGRHAAADRSAINDFVVKFANVNGSGSASANSAVRQVDPAHGRAGRARATSSPRTSRACRPGTRCGSPRAGHLGRRGGVDLMVAMNPQTWDEDVAEIEPGGYLFYDSTKPLPPSKFRDDINVIGMPLTAICNREYTDAAPAPAVQEHHLCRRAVGAARHRCGRDREADRRAVPGQGHADQAQPAGAASGPRLRARHTSSCPLGAARSTAPTRSATASSSTATSAAALGCRLWRRDGLRLVSDHAVDLAGRGLRGGIAAASASTRRPRRSASRSSRPRTSSPRSAW